MSLIAEFSTASDGFAVGRALRAPPGGTIQLERVVPIADGRVQYCRVRGDVDAATFEAALEAEPAVERVEVVSEPAVDDLSLLVEWQPDAYDGIFGVVQANDGVVLGADGRQDRWTFRLRFPSSSHLGRFQRALTAAGVEADLGRVYEVTGDDGDPNFGLTDPQREAIVTAVETGYFRVPREISTSDLGAILGISDQAASERIRRGMERLARNALRVDTDD